MNPATAHPQLPDQSATPQDTSRAVTLGINFSEREPLVAPAGLSAGRDGQSKASPFVKWVGGKRSVMGELTSRLPKHFEEYWEPFVGGGALFFELAPTLRSAHLSDANTQLVTTYQVIQNAPDKLLQRLRKHAEQHSEKYYYAIREDHEQQDDIEVAARFIYLNKTCYNGLWRVNKQGRFNVPIGRFANPGIVQEDNIRACCKVLQSVTICRSEFNDIQPNRHDFVYFDPPYDPVDETSFTKYSASDFSQHDQMRLRDFIIGLHSKGVYIMLSNSDTPLIRDIYSKNMFTVSTVQAPRMVNCKSGGRGGVNEVIITNYSLE